VNTKPVVARAGQHGRAGAQGNDGGSLEPLGRLPRGWRGSKRRGDLGAAEGASLLAHANVPRARGTGGEMGVHEYEGIAVARSRQCTDDVTPMPRLDAAHAGGVPRP
jgi:hypothetical protein